MRTDGLLPLEVRVGVRLLRRNRRTERAPERGAAGGRVERRPDGVRQHRLQRNRGIAPQVAQLLPFDPEVAGALVQELAQYGERVRGTAVRRLAAGAAPRGDQREGRRRVTRAVQGRLGTDGPGLESRGETDRIGVAGEVRLE